MAGGRSVGFSQSVYLSEKETAYTNYALSFYMRSAGAYPEHFDADLLRKSVDLYLQGCSAEVTCRTVGSPGMSDASRIAGFSALLLLLALLL